MIIFDSPIDRRTIYMLMGMTLLMISVNVVVFVSLLVGSKYYSAAMVVLLSAGVAYLLYTRCHSVAANMSFLVRRWFWTKIEVELYTFAVAVPHNQRQHFGKMNAEVREWCAQNLRRRYTWNIVVGSARPSLPSLEDVTEVLLFQDPNDAMLFKLRWIED